MTIQEEFAAELKDAMRNRDKPRLNVIRQVQTEVSVAKTADGFFGEADDDLYTKIISGYVKKMNKARKEFEAAGVRGAERAAGLAYEVQYLARWLPAQLGEAEILQLVQKAIAEVGADDPKQIGQVTGAVMRSGRDLDGTLVSKLVREELGA